MWCWIADFSCRSPPVFYSGNVRVYGDAFTKIAALEKVGAQVVVLPDVSGRVDLNAALRDLAANGCNEVLVEAGRFEWCFASG